MLPRVTNFNSIKVQLEPEFGLYKSQIDDFNSIKVQLELDYCLVSLYGEMDFNSIKVQLEQNFLPNCLVF